jgi:hypothetical protein
MVSLDEDLSPTIDVNTGCGCSSPSRRKIPSVGRIECRIDIPNGLPHAHSMPSAIQSQSRSGTLVTDEINTDVIAVMHKVIRHPELGDVSIQHD